jgi:hypothetical protein
MRKTIAKELSILLPNSGINSIDGKYSMRFELGGEGNSESAKRITQATERGIEIFNQLIGEDEIIIAIEEWQNEFFDSNDSRKTIINILEETQLKRIKGPFKQTYFEENEDGVKVEKIFEDDLECDLLIGKLDIKEHQAKEIIKGIASLEMGEEPCIPQNVYFFSGKKEAGFRIYDDRGCDIWANSLKTLRPLYENLNSWILDYNREEIDKMFE